MNKLEQAARALLAHWDTPAWRYLKPTGDLMADLREALVEQAEQEPQHSEHYWMHEINNARADGYERGYVAAKKLYAEQAEQEPVAWGYFDADGSFMDALDRQHGAYQTPLYAVPVHTKDLTDAEIGTLVQRHTIDGKVMPFALCEAVIAADREKNK